MKLVIFIWILILIGITNSFAGDKSDTLKCVLMDENYNICYEVDYKSRLIEGDELGNVAGFDYSATSYLASIDTNSYKPDNIGDRKTSTAWIEGVKEYGIGEQFIVKIELPEYIKSRKLSSIEFLNGYSKSEKIWKANSRIKTLKLILNKSDLIIVELLDKNWPQILLLPEEKNIEIKNGDILSFEILDIYPGTKYKDTALTEILFNVPL